MLSVFGTCLDFVCACGNVAAGYFDKIYRINRTGTAFFILKILSILSKNRFEAFMAIKERTQQMRVIAEIMLVHLPDVLPKDQALAHDLLAVVGTALHAIYEDAEQSAKAWDKKAYHSRADEMRQEWEWALAAANYALGLALRPDPLTTPILNRMRVMIRPGLERPARHQISDPERFRGAAQAVRVQQSQKRAPIRG